MRALGPILEEGREKFGRLGLVAQICSIVVTIATVAMCIFTCIGCGFSAVSVRKDLDELVGGGEGISEAMLAFRELAVVWWRPVAIVVLVVILFVLAKVYGRRFWMWALWRGVVKPARDRFGVEAARESWHLDAGEAERVRRGGIRALSNDCLAVLTEALNRQEGGSRVVVVGYPHGVGLDPKERGLPQAKERLAAACSELLDEGWISGYREPGFRHGGGLEVHLTLLTARPYWVDRVRLETRLEVLRREMRAMPRPARGRGGEASEPEGWGERLGELSVLALEVLGRLLYLYDRTSGEVVICRDRSDSEGVNTAVRIHGQGDVDEALEQLVAEGFLKERQWEEGEELQVRLGPLVPTRSAARQLDRWVDRELMERGVVPWETDVAF